MNAVFVPRPAIGKSNLSAERCVALLDAHVMGKRCRTISVAQAEYRIACGERQNMSATVECGECLVRDFTNSCALIRGIGYGGVGHGALSGSSRTFVAQTANVRFWHLADITTVLLHVRFWG